MAYQSCISGKLYGAWTNVHVSGACFSNVRLSLATNGNAWKDDAAAYDQALGQTYLSHACVYTSNTLASSAGLPVPVGLYRTTVDSCSFAANNGVSFGLYTSASLFPGVPPCPLDVTVSNCWFLLNWVVGGALLFSPDSSGPVAVGFTKPLRGLVLNCLFESPGGNNNGAVALTGPSRMMGCRVTSATLAANLAEYAVSQQNTFSNMSGVVFYTYFNNNLSYYSINDTYGPDNGADIDITPHNGARIAIVAPVSSNLRLRNAPQNQVLFSSGQSSVTSLNGILNNDIVYTTYGTCSRTGPGLPDTTSRSPNSYAVKLRPDPQYTAMPLTWPVDTDTRLVPVGNAQGKPVTVSVWVMMGTAFYAGTAINPTLNVYYDGTASGSVVAPSQPGWQQLAVTVRPQTPVPWVEAWLATASDSGAPVYMDDWKVALPPGRSVNTQGLDTWVQGKVAWPPYTTSAPAVFSMASFNASASPPASVETLLYTVPINAVSTVANSLVVCNRGATPTTFRISVSPGGAPTAPGDYLYYDAAITGNNTFAATLGLSLSPGEVVRVYGGNGNLSFSIWGSQVAS
jgi:hypothetical protein